MRLVVPAVVVAITVAALAGRAAADLASAAPPEELDPEAASSPTLAEMYEEWSAPGEHVRFETPNGPVHVWTPAGYVPETAITIVYVHGYAIDVDDAWLAHGLPEQFGASRVNAMFIASEAPADKLEPLRWTSPTALLEAVERELGRPVPSSRVIAIGHSGAYRTLERWVLDRKLGGIVLLDAGYASIVPFRDWARRSQAHRLIVVAHDTVHWSAVLRRYLPGMKSYYDGFAQFADPALLATARGHRLLDIRCDLGHWGIVNGGVALPTVLRLLHGVEASGGD